MTIDGQTIIAVLIVALSASMLVRQTKRFLKGESQGCSACPSKSSLPTRVKSLPLVQLQQRKDNSV